MCSPDSKYYASPCLDVANVAHEQCDHSIYYGNPRHDAMHSLIFVRKPPNVPSFVNTTLLSMTSTTVTVNITLSDDGIVYCAAMISPPTSILDVQMKNIWSYSTNYKASLAFTDLIGATTYHIYCFTQSLDQVPMTYKTMLTTGIIPFRTPCCKEYSISILTKLVKLGLPSVNAFQISIGALPQAPNYTTISFELHNSRRELVSASFAPSVLNISRYNYIIIFLTYQYVTIIISCLVNRILLTKSRCI